MSETMIKSRRVSKKCSAATAKLKDMTCNLKQSTKISTKTHINKLYKENYSMSPSRPSVVQTCKYKKRSKTPIFKKFSSKKELQLTKESSGPRRQLNKRSNSSTRLISSVKEFEILGSSHRSMIRNVSHPVADTEIYIPDFPTEPYGNQLITTFERTKQLLKSYSDKYNGLLKVNEKLSQELKALHREMRKSNNSGIKL